LEEQWQGMETECGVNKTMKTTTVTTTTATMTSTIDDTHYHNE
jgi:hypothetical protein